MSKKIILVLGADDMPGGVSGYVHNVISLSDKNKYEFHMTVSGKRLGDYLRNKFITRHVFPVTYSILNLIAQLLKLRKLIKSVHAQVIHIHTARAGFIGCLACYGLSVSIIYTGHGWCYEQKNNRFQKLIFYYFEKFICRNAVCVTFSTEYDKQSGVLNRLLNEDKGVVITTRIDCTQYDNISAEAIALTRSKLLIPDNALVVGTIGYMSERKDPFTFVRIASKVINDVPNVYFLWIGDGELKHKTIQLSEKLGIQDNVIITGFITPEQIPTYLKVMNVFLFTSHSEGLPLSIISAQASRLPIVCSRYIGSGFDEIIEHNKSGYLFNICDVEAASKYIILCLTDNISTNKIIGEMSSTFLSKYSNAILMTKEFEKLYDQY